MNRDYPRRKLNHAIKNFVENINKSNPRCHVGRIIEYIEGEELSISLFLDNEEVILSFTDGLLILADVNLVDVVSLSTTRVTEEANVNLININATKVDIKLINSNYKVGDSIVLVPVLNQYLVIKTKELP